MAYHLQGDGQMEQINQELEQYLCLFVNERQDNWDELLPLAEFQYNNHIHSTTQQTPFMLDSGRHPWMGFEPHQVVSGDNLQVVLLPYSFYFPLILPPISLTCLFHSYFPFSVVVMVTVTLAI